MKRLLLLILIIGVISLSACDGESPEPAHTPDASTVPAKSDEPAPATAPKDEPTLVTSPKPATSPKSTPSPTPEEKTSPAPTAPDTPATPTSPEPKDEPPPTPEPEQIKGSDDSVTIVIDKIERADVMPDNIVEALSIGRPYKAPAPAAGCDFFCIYLTIPRIENIHMTDVFGYGEEDTALFDNMAQNYKRITANVKGIEYHDLHDLTGSYEIVEGATAFWVFEVPKDEDPSRFEFIYTYKIDLEGETENGGQIDIIIE